MEYEWDDVKNAINIQKHKISFQLAAEVFMDEDRLELFDEEHSTFEEERYITIGMIRSVIIIVVVVYTFRNDKYRIISARKANDGEREAYNYGRL